MALMIERRRCAAQAPSSQDLQHAHIAGGRAVFVRRDGRIDIHDLASGVCVRSVSRPNATQARLAPSGRRVVIHGREKLSCELVSVDDGASLVSFQRIGRRPQTVNASFLVDPSGSDVMLLARQDYVLEGFRADDASSVFRIECRDPIVYYFTDPVAMLDGDTIIALGLQPTESKDSFYRFSLALCRDDPETAGRMDPAHTAPAEYAYRVAAGPCGTDALVAFRDAGEHEDPDDREISDDPLYGFTGLYVRRLGDGEVLDRIRYDAAIETGAPLMGTRDAIIVARDDEVDILDRGLPEPDFSTLRAGPGGRYLLEPSTASVYEVSANGEIHAITVQRAR